jgi:peptidoglycan/LPS O-acetylase OafA/YrhL
MWGPSELIDLNVNILYGTNPMKNPKRPIVWGIVALLIVTMLVAVQFTDEVSWSEAVAYSILLLIPGGIYELALFLKKRSRVYRAAFIIGLMAALLLGWMNGAVGIIGSEDNPANLLYGAVFAVGLLGSFISRFKPRGMARTLFIAAVAPLLVPVAALIVWRPDFSPGVLGVFALNGFFALLFVGSGLLFRRAAGKDVRVRN